MKKFMMTLGITIFLMSSLIAQSPKKEILLDPFKNIECSGTLQVTLYPSSNEKVIVVSSNPKLLDKVIVKQNNNTLVLYNKSKINQNETIEVAVHYRHLSNIECSGAVDIKTGDELKGDKLNVEISGAVDVDFKLNVQELNSELSGASKVNFVGVADLHDLEISGAANLSAKNLRTSKTFFEASGASNGNIFASELIEGERSGVALMNYNHSAKKIIINDKIVKKNNEIFNGKLDDADVYLINKKNKDSIKVSLSEFMNKIADTINKEDYALRIYKDKVMIYLPEADVQLNALEFVEEDDNSKHEILINSEGLTILKNGLELFGRKKRFDGHWEGFSIGINGMFNADHELKFPDEYEKMDLNYQKCINLALNLYDLDVNLIKNKFGFITGIGFMWDNYRFDNDVILSHDENKLSFKEPNPKKNYKKSKLAVTYLTVPLLFEFQSGRRYHNFYISGGVVGGLRIGTHTKIKYSNGSKDKDRHDFYMNPFRADAMIRVGVKWLNLYGSYGLVSLFRDDKGPEMYPFNMGLHINF